MAASPDSGPPQALRGLCRLAEQGYDPVFGARPLKRAIQRMVKNPLARELLAGRFREGENVIVDVKGGGR